MVQNRPISGNTASNYEETGMVRYRYPVRLAEVTDGTSNTLLA
jgi:hypothetical protein